MSGAQSISPVGRMACTQWDTVSCTVSSPRADRRGPHVLVDLEASPFHGRACFAAPSRARPPSPARAGHGIGTMTRDVGRPP